MRDGLPPPSTEGESGGCRREAQPICCTNEKNECKQKCKSKCDRTPSKMKTWRGLGRKKNNRNVKSNLSTTPKRVVDINLIEEAIRESKSRQAQAKSSQTDSSDKVQVVKYCELEGRSMADEMQADREWERNCMGNLPDSSAPLLADAMMKTGTAELKDRQETESNNGVTDIHSPLPDNEIDSTANQERWKRQRQRSVKSKIKIHSGN